MISNLAPKLNQYSKISSSVRSIINEVLENPIIIPNYLSSNITVNKQVSSFNNNMHICEYQYNDLNNLNKYLGNYKNNKLIWEKTPFNEKKDIFLKTADLIETKYYDKMIAYTILGQNKTPFEAELDAICELVDFLRFNVYYAEKIMEKQPIQTENIQNISEYNSLNGFITSITPFNFIAIGGNLASAPLLFGNSVLWKPSESAILSNYLFYEIMLEAGLPEGVLNFCPMDANIFMENILGRKDLAGLLFTGSSEVQSDIFKKIYTNIELYNNYPRIIGESGGKNFHFVDPDYNLDNIDFIVEKTLESAFNYSGQKCSACSILYLPENLLDNFVELMKEKIKIFLINHENYGVINDRAYKKLVGLLRDFENDNDINHIIKNNYNKDERYYIEPQVLVCRNHNHRVFNEEFFGPILSIYPYQKENFENVIENCINSNNYALTGSVFSKNENFINYMSNKLRHKAGNFYINDKSTGSVVGQQPFGGAGKSGTNDKAGDFNLLYRLFNQRNIKINNI
jgi:1-pyrroline-5-carboxylate dehydrogenase